MRRIRTRDRFAGALIPDMKLWHHFALSFLWLPAAMTFNLLVSLVVPDQVPIRALAAHLGKGTAMSLVIVSGVPLQVLTGPISAAATDPTSWWASGGGTRQGFSVRRIRLFVSIGTLVALPAIAAILWPSSSYWLLFAGYCMYQIGSTLQMYTSLPRRFR